APAGERGPVAVDPAVQQDEVQRPGALGSIGERGGDVDIALPVARVGYLELADLRPVGGAPPQRDGAAAGTRGGPQADLLDAREAEAIVRPPVVGLDETDVHAAAGAVAGLLGLHARVAAAGRSGQASGVGEELRLQE